MDRAIKLKEKLILSIVCSFSLAAKLADLKISLKAPAFQGS